MEHYLLHAVQLIGLFLSLGGPLLVLWGIRPACVKLGASDAREKFATDLEAIVGQWVCYGALAATIGACADFFVQTAELKGKTVFNGVSLSLAGNLATETWIGRIGLARVGTLLLVALVARWSWKGRWWLLVFLAGAGTILASLVSHAAAQPISRAPAIATQVMHLCGGAAWLGVLLHLLAARARLETAAGRECFALTVEVVRRFSPWAMGAVCLLLLSGLISVFRFISEPGAVLTSAYGLTLLLKLILVCLVLYAGYQNFALVRPALLRLACKHHSDSASEAGDQAALAEKTKALVHFGRMLELEVTAGLLAVTVAGILGSVSPPGKAGTQRLTTLQAQVLLCPHLPTTDIVNPGTFYGAEARTLNDLRYSEFMHNWSGLAVLLLGLCWLIHSLRNHSAAWVTHVWPGLLVGFGIFIGVASDPEVWLLRRVSFWTAVGDPQLLEHQLGAGMVFLLAWMAWRSRRQPAGDGLMGYGLPGVMIFGSLLLLGHAHSSFNATEQLTNLINVQHAIFGTCGLLAGTVRWLALRTLIPLRLANWVWPVFVVGLGIFMAFYYREVV